MLVGAGVERKPIALRALQHVAFELPSEPVHDAVHEREERRIDRDVADGGVGEKPTRRSSSTSSRSILEGLSVSFAT